MAVQNPPVFIQAGSHPAEDFRRMMHSLVGQRGGIVNAGDLAVTQNGTPNMSINVATGDVFIPGTEATYQGVYHCENRGSLNVSVTAAHATNGRRDLVVARVYDQAYSGSTNVFALEVLAGTPAASPADPTVPANCWVLARLTVDAAVTSIVTAKITDLRTSYTGQARAAALGGVIVCTSTTRPTVNLDAGDMIYETDTKFAYVYNGSTWDPLSAVATAWTAPTLLNSWSNFGFSHQVAQYRKIGDIVYCRGLIRLGLLGSAAFTLPTGFRPPGDLLFTSTNNAQPGEILVQTTGNVTPQQTTNIYHSLNEVIFSTST